MEDPFGFIDAYCHYSTSQEELLKNSLLAREHLSPDSCSPSPSPSAAAFEGNGIIICSAPETPASETVASPSGDEFKTPPEESRRSSSEEAPPPPPPPSQMLSPSHGIDGGHRTPAVETDCGYLDGGTQDLGFSDEGNRTPKMVEILSDGRVRVGEVSKLDLESFRVGEKSGRPVQTPSPSKRIRVSVDSSVLVSTPNLAAREEGECSEKTRMECPIEIGVKVNMEVETQVNDLDSGNGKADQIIDTEVIEDDEDGEADCVNNVGISTVEQEQEEEEEMEEEEEEGMENGNGNRVAVVDGDGAKDLSRQGKRSLPQSWACRNGGSREDEDHSNAERASSGNGKCVVLDVLRWLAREQREKRRDRGGSIDFIETVKRRGVMFPEPRWCRHKQ